MNKILLFLLSLTVGISLNAASHPKLTLSADSEANLISENGAVSVYFRL